MKNIDRTTSGQSVATTTSPRRQTANIASKINSKPQAIPVASTTAVPFRILKVAVRKDFSIPVPPQIQVDYT
jgi:hypothetical protein